MNVKKKRSEEGEQRKEVTLMDEGRWSVLNQFIRRLNLRHRGSNRVRIFMIKYVHLYVHALACTFISVVNNKCKLMDICNCI